MGTEPLTESTLVIQAAICGALICRVMCCPRPAKILGKLTSWRLLTAAAQRATGVSSAAQTWFEYVSDGAAVDAIIIGTGDRTNPNATDVDNRVYMIRDRATLPYSTVRPTSSECTDPDVLDLRCDWPISDDNLYDITENDITTGTDEVKIAAIESLEACRWLAV